MVDAEALKKQKKKKSPVASIITRLLRSDVGKTSSCKMIVSGFECCSSLGGFLRLAVLLFCHSSL